MKAYKISENYNTGHISTFTKSDGTKFKIISGDSEGYYLVEEGNEDYKEFEFKKLIDIKEIDNKIYYLALTNGNTVLCKWGSGRKIVNDYIISFDKSDINGEIYYLVEN